MKEYTKKIKLSVLFIKWVFLNNIVLILRHQNSQNKIKKKIVINYLHYLMIHKINADESI